MRRHLLLLLLFLALPPAPSVAADTVRFGLREAAPLVETGPDGRLRGLEYELLTAIMAAAGLKMEPYVGSNARLALAAGEGAVDGFAPVVGAVPDGLVLTDSYITYHNVALTLAARDISLKTPADLGGLRVLAFQRATRVLGPDFADAIAAAADYREEPVQALQAKGLLYGRYDVLIGESRVLMYHVARVLAESGDQKQTLPVVEHRLFAPNHYCAGFRDPAMAARFNEGLRRVREDGSYQAILNRYDVTQ
ncbi:substrate-binding periplasmic protein [Niveispirillum sp. KHB5.9]|uniref:substrate-binding periplasmic protein n=1 Tax=Niveispirillum sp. KHB5.9 TaxID=3400269 RepID=UPI003A8C5D7F